MHPKMRILSLFLCVMLLLPVQALASEEAVDVSEEDPYYDAVSYVCGAGLMNGTGADTFGPEVPASRAMAVTVLWRMAEKPVVNYLMVFSDVAAESWYTEAVRWAASERIAAGYSSECFGTDDAVTKEQLAVLLYRYTQSEGGGFTGEWMFRLDASDLTEISEWAYEAVCWCVMNGVIDAPGGGPLEPQSQLNRAQLADMLMRFLSLK